MRDFELINKKQKSKTKTRKAQQNKTKKNQQISKWKKNNCNQLVIHNKSFEFCELFDIKGKLENYELYLKNGMNIKMRLDDACYVFRKC